MRIIAFGDIHESTENVSKIEGISSADWVIVTGDLTNLGETEKARTVLEHIQKYNRNIYAQAGNFDQRNVDDYLSELGINLHARGFFLKQDLGIFGVGGSNFTPFHTPIEYAEDQIRDFIRLGYESVKGAAKRIFVSHAPPYDTGVDVIRGGMHVGSKAVRSFIEQHQPDLCITGHIHESQGQDVLGKTVIINPGMLQKGGYVEILVEDVNLKAQLRQAPGRDA